MLYGILEGNKVHLSEISRSLKENIPLKKTIERLSRNLNHFDSKKALMDAYIPTQAMLTARTVTERAAKAAETTATAIITRTRTTIRMTRAAAKMKMSITRSPR